MDEAKILQLKDEIEDAQHIVFFGGAGVSTESGVPDFRSKDGLYNQRDVRFDKYRPEYLLSHSCLIYEPKVYYEFHRQKMDTRTIEPNNAHKYLAAIEKLGKLDAVVTQNIDGLHQKAGSKNVLELHGSVLRNTCMKCGKFHTAEEVFGSEGIPRCECGGIIKPDVVLYEEGLDGHIMERAARAIYDADMLIVAGTSLTVYPAAGMIRYYRGKRLVLINRDTTPYDSEANLVIHESMGEVFSEL